MMYMLSYPKQQPLDISYEVMPLFTTLHMFD